MRVLPAFSVPTPGFPPPWASVGTAPEALSCDLGGAFVPFPMPTVPADTHELSFRDEQIVIYRRRGLSIWQIHKALGHPPREVLATVRAAETAGIRLAPDP